MERSSPSRTAGVVIRKVTLAGVEYTLSVPTKVRKAADEEAVVIARRLDMLPAIARSCASLPEAERIAWRQSYITSMLIGIASKQEWAAYYDSLWNLAFLFWNALDPSQKGNRTLMEGVAWAYELVNDENVTNEEVGSLWIAIKMVGQEETLKNSSGSAEEATPPMDSPNTTVGLPSIATTSTVA